MFSSTGGKEYFDELKSEIDRSGVEFIYLAGWWLDSDFSLDGAGGTPKLADLLKSKAAAGVDVRVLGWIMPPEVIRNSAVQSQLMDMMMLNGDTMYFVEQLRKEPKLAGKACLNILSHPAGAVHAKMAIVGGGGQAVGFTGGLDLQGGRHDRMWHDVQVKVAGPAVQGLYAFFSEMWAEISSRSPAVGLTSSTNSGLPVTIDSHSSSMPAMPARTFTATGGDTVVQSVGTLPQFNIYQLSTTERIGTAVSGLSLPGNVPLSYAPSGRFEVKAVWEKAIKAATKYIYIEDQALTSSDVFSWINDAVRLNDELKVILVMGGNDPTAASPPTMMSIMNTAINGTLLGGLDEAQVDNIGLFLYHDVGGNVKFVHTKSTIVDDQWAIVGSANCMRRSLYTDFEHSVAFMDSHGAVPKYRSRLWAEHLKSTIVSADASLNAWFSIPFISSSSPNTLDIDRIPLWPIGTSLKRTSLNADEQVLADELLDVDSRQAWGEKIVKAVVKKAGTSIMAP